MLIKLWLAGWLIVFARIGWAYCSKEREEEVDR